VCTDFPQLQKKFSKVVAAAIIRREGVDVENRRMLKCGKVFSTNVHNPEGAPESEPLAAAGYRQRRRRMSKKIPRSDLSTLSTPIIILIFRF
jgi:hypothetical protein